MDKKDVTWYVLVTLTILSISYLAYITPIENILSVYSFRRIYPWYLPWRIALVNFFGWLSLEIIPSSSKNKYLFFAKILCLLLFLIGHYWSLYIVASKGYRVEIIPLFYVTYWRNIGTLHLDLGQVVVLYVVGYFLWRKFSKKFTLRKPPQTPSNT